MSLFELIPWPALKVFCLILTTVDCISLKRKLQFAVKQASLPLENKNSPIKKRLVVLLNQPSLKSCFDDHSSRLQIGSTEQFDDHFERTFVEQCDDQSSILQFCVTTYKG